MDILSLLLGIGITLGSLLSNIPQFYNIIKYKSVEGISELSLIIQNVGMSCLTMNSLINNWNNFFCFSNKINISDTSNTSTCFENILPFISIGFSWIMILVYYIIFIVYKIKKIEKRVILGFNYCITYILFLILVIGMAVGEKWQGNNSFFASYANVLGIMSAVLNGLVYIPQIYLLLKNGHNGNLSLLTYCIQTPGNFIIIIYQAVISLSPLTTWITYLIVLVEQTIILIIMIANIVHQRDQKENNERERVIQELNEEW